MYRVPYQEIFQKILLKILKNIIYVQDEQMLAEDIVSTTVVA